MKRIIALGLSILICLAAAVPVFAEGLPEKDERVSLVYLYGGTNEQYRELIRGVEGINTVSPDYFNLAPDGSLFIPPAKQDTAFVDDMHRRDILVVPYLSNYWNRELGAAALSNRVKLTAQLADMVNRYGFDGVNIDIENQTEEFREAYTDFVRLLKEQLPDKLVTVAVAANPTGEKTGYAASYDDLALSEVSDYLILMAYDESYPGGPAGPVASAPFFEASIQNALNAGVPKDKLVVGIPLYGRYWRMGDAEGGFGLTDADIQGLIDNYSSQVRYSYPLQSANAIVTIKETDKKPTVLGGRILPEGIYNIWYDNIEATNFKLQRIAELGLRGVARWALTPEGA